MVQIFFEAIFPALLVAGLAAWCLVIAGRLASHRIARWTAERRMFAAQAQNAIARSAERTRAVAAARNAIAAAITELSSRPATYSTFPPDVLTLLHDAHACSPHLDATGDHL
jgi:hypothetical protein